VSKTVVHTLLFLPDSRWNENSLLVLSLTCNTVYQYLQHITT